MALADADFWTLTLGLFFRLVDRWRDQRAREDRRAGEVVAMLYNANRDAKRDPKGKAWDDFFPQDAKKQQPEPQTEEQMLMAMQMWAARLNKRTAKA